MASYQKKEESNWNKASQLLTEAGKDLLTHFLYQSVSATSHPSLDAFLASHRKTIQHLVDRQILHDTQMDILYPDSGFTDTDQWDITLLACVLNKCFTNKTCPQKLSITKIQDLRNRLAHDGTRKMNDDEFAKIWKDIQHVLTIAARDLLINPCSFSLLPKVNRIQKEEIVDGEKLINLLQAWKSCDIALFDAIEEVKEGQQAINTDARLRHTEMKSMIEGGISEIKSKIAEDRKCHEEFIKKSIAGERKEKSEIKNIEGCCQGTSTGQSQQIPDTVQSLPHVCQLAVGSSHDHSSSLKRRVNEEWQVAQPSLKKPIYGCPACTTPMESVSTVSEQQVCPIWSLDLRCMQSGLLEYYKTRIVKSPIGVHETSRLADISDLYAEPKMVLIDHTAFSKETAEKEGIQFKDVFGGRDKEQRNIYMTGDAGMGKTVFCKDIVATWCRAHSESQGPSEDADKISTMRQFDFLFYVSLRHATDQYEIEDMILSQLLYKNKFIKPCDFGGRDPKEVLNGLFQHHSERCLIILDGLDEWTSPRKSHYPSVSNGIPGRSPHLRYTILTTLRPWKLEVIRLKDLEIDLQIELLGVASPFDFGNRIVWYYNNLSKKQKEYHDFHTVLIEKDLTDMARLPILLKQLICLWHNDQPLGRSRTEVYTNMLELLFKLAEQRDGSSAFCVEKYSSNVKEVDTGLFFKKGSKCERNKSLLLSLGQLSFDTVFREDRETKLVFESTEAEICGMSTEEIDKCLSIGILTQSIVPSMICIKKSLSFLHKTFHEYCAALYLYIYGKNIKDLTTRFRSRCHSLKNLYDIKDMLIFLSEMSPSLVEALSGSFVDAVNNDPLVLTGRNGIDFEEIASIVQSTILQCCKESSDNDHGELHLPIPDVIHVFKFGTIKDERDQEVLAKCLQRFPSEVVTFQWSFSRRSSSYTNILAGTISRESMESGNSTQVKYNVDLTNHCNINRFTLLGDGQHIITWRLDENLLSYLDLFNVISPQVISTIKRASMLKTLRLGSVRPCLESLDGFDYSWDLELSGYTELIRFDIHHISLKSVTVSPSIKHINMKNIETHTPDGLQALFTSISKAHCLESIHLIGLKCKDDGTRIEKENTLDLLRLRELKECFIERTCLASVVLSPAITELTLKYINTLSHSRICSLLSSLSNAHLLQKIRLESLQCRDNNIGIESRYTLDLSGLRELRSCVLKEISLASIVFSPAITNVVIENVHTLTHNGICSLLSSISIAHSLTSIHLKSVKCEGHASQVECGERILDLTRHVALRYIELKDMSLESVSFSPSVEVIDMTDIQMTSHEGMHSLISSMDCSKSLKKICLNSVECVDHASAEECEIDLDLLGHNDLIALDLYNMQLQSMAVNPATSKTTWSAGFDWVRMSYNKRSISLKNIHFLKHAGMGSLMACISKMRAGSIRLRAVKCKEHSNSDECGFGQVVDVSNDGDDPSAFKKLIDEFNRQKQEAILPPKKLTENENDKMTV